jgi:hypothetical protein
MPIRFIFIPWRIEPPEQSYCRWRGAGACCGAGEAGLEARRRLAQVEREIANLITAIKAGIVGALLGGEIRLHPMPQGRRGPGRLRRAGAAHAGAPRGRGRRGWSI